MLQCPYCLCGCGWDRTLTIVPVEEDVYWIGSRVLTLGMPKDDALSMLRESYILEEYGGVDSYMVWLKESPGPWPGRCSGTSSLSRRQTRYRTEVLGAMETVGNRRSACVN